MAKALCLVNGDIVLQDINSATWGSISGTLSSQTDLNTALTSKIDKTKSFIGIFINYLQKRNYNYL